MWYNNYVVFEFLSPRGPNEGFSFRQAVPGLRKVVFLLCSDVFWTMVWTCTSSRIMLKKDLASTWHIRLKLFIMVRKAHMLLNTRWQRTWSHRDKLPRRILESRVLIQRTCQPTMVARLLWFRKHMLLQRYDLQQEFHATADISSHVDVSTQARNPKIQMA